MRLKRGRTASHFRSAAALSSSRLNGAALPWRSVVIAESPLVCYPLVPSYIGRMNFEQWIVWLSLLGGLLFSLAAAFSPKRRLYLAMPAVILFLIFGYEIRMDRWEKTVSAPIRLDMVAEIPLMVLCLAFGTWQMSRRREEC